MGSSMVDQVATGNGPQNDKANRSRSRFRGFLRYANYRWRNGSDSVIYKAGGRLNGVTQRSGGLSCFGKSA